MNRNVRQGLGFVVGAVIAFLLGGAVQLTWEDPLARPAAIEVIILSLGGIMAAALLAGLVMIAWGLFRTPR